MFMKGRRANWTTPWLRKWSRVKEGVKTGCASIHLNIGASTDPSTSMGNWFEQLQYLGSPMNPSLCHLTLSLADDLDAARCCAPKASSSVVSA
eukprot:2968333-Amphidinium_carterae.2